MLNTRVENMRYVMEKICESPLERLFFIELVEILRENIYVECPIELILERDNNRRVALRVSLTDNDLSLWAKTTGFGIRHEIEVIPQFEIVIESEPVWKYRVDFLIRVWEYFPEKPRSLVIAVAVELDGHDFHERTKEQAQRDKHRDRQINKQAIIVLRYTGSEIFRSAQRRLKMVEPEKKLLSDINQITAETIEVISQHINNRLKLYGIDYGL